MKELLEKWEKRIIDLYNDRANYKSYEAVYTIIEYEIEAVQTCIDELKETF